MIKKLSIIPAILSIIIGIGFISKINKISAQEKMYIMRSFEAAQSDFRTDNTNEGGSLLQTEPQPINDQVIVSLLNPYISKQVLKIYGEITQYSVAEAKVLSIVQDNWHMIFEVTIQIQTFQGPHNPPYGYDTFKFLVTPSFVELLNYSHIIKE